MSPRISSPAHTAGECMYFFKSLLICAISAYIQQLIVNRLPQRREVQWQEEEEQQEVPAEEEAEGTMI